MMEGTRVLSADMSARRKRAAKWLCIAIGLMLISMIVVSIVQTSGGKVTIRDLTWETTSGYQMNGLLFIPKGASAKNPLPAIVTSHGMYNNREMQDANYVELSRRGFVVLSMNMLSHGSSENVDNIGTLTTGMYEAVKMLASINFVDASRIGITGHSLGGMSSNVAISLDNAAPQRLISAVLLNCADATYADKDTKAYIDIYGSRNAGIVAAQYDEFFMRDVDANGNQTWPPEYIRNKNAQSFLHFGNDPTGLDKRAADTVYTEQVDGRSAMRVIYNPAIIHPWSHFSKRSTAATIDFFSRAFGAPAPIDPGNQVWQIKELFNLIGLIGFAVFLVNFAILMVFTPFFSALRSEEAVAPRPIDARGQLWFWGGLVACALFGIFTYLPILKGVNAFGLSRSPWAQTSPWGVGCWAAACGLFAILFMYIYKRANADRRLSAEETGIKLSSEKFWKTILLSIIVITVSYLCVFFADYFFKSDFRIWVLAVKAFDSSKLFVALFPYLELFLVYYVANSVAINCFNYNTIGLRNGKGGWINTAILAVFNAMPAIVLLLIQYAHYFGQGSLEWPAGNMFIVWLFPMLITLSVTAVISRKLYRVTRNPYLPGIINAILITLISCTNTLTWK